MGSASLHTLRSFADPSGVLTVAEAGSEIPFQVERAFWITSVAQGATRGSHAHRECHQFILCLAGSVTAEVFHGGSSESFTLDSPHLGLHLPPMNWVVLKGFSPGAAVLVFASHHYREEDYVRDYGEFLSLSKGEGGWR